VESIRALLEALEVHFPGRAVRLVFGCSADKNIRGMLALLAPRAASLITTRSNSPRAADEELLARVGREMGAARARAVAGCVEAVRACLQEAAPDELVCVTGSFFVAGEVRRAWQRGELT